MTALDVTQIPALAELRTWPQWVAWKLKPGRDGRPRKVPVDPRTYECASVAVPQSWAAFEVAAAAVATYPKAYQGLGFVLTADDPYVALDLDHCVDLLGADPGAADPETQAGVWPPEGPPGERGRIAPWARAIVVELASYTEITPSGRGLRIFVRGSLPPHGRRRGPLEMYDTRRFVTVTGRHLPGTPLTIEDRPEALAAIHASVFGEVAELWPAELDMDAVALDGAAAVDTKPVFPDRAGADAGPIILSDAEVALVSKAQAARNGARFTALWAGQWRELGYPSQSEADLALCSMLVFRTGGDAAQADRLFRASGLMRPKWDATRGRLTYGASTIRQALSRSMFGCQRLAAHVMRPAHDRAASALLNRLGVMDSVTCYRVGDRP